MNVSDELIWKLVNKTVQYVYRLFDVTDEIIYVGITSDLQQRWMQHQYDKPWWPEVMRKEVWVYETREEALAVEFALIASLRPRYNIAPGQSPTIQLLDDGSVLTQIRRTETRLSSRPSHTAPIYAWIHEQLDAGVELTGAMLRAEFPEVKSNGSRMVKFALNERASREKENYDEDPAEETEALGSGQDLEVHQAPSQASQADAPYAA